LRGIQIQLTGASSVADDGIVMFNTILNDQSLNIDYNPATGIVTLSAEKNYYVYWWVSTDGAGPSTYVEFTLRINTSGNVSASSPIVTGQLNGMAFLTIGAVPATLSLLNTTGSTVNYAQVPIMASMVIIEAN